MSVSDRNDNLPAPPCPEAIWRCGAVAGVNVLFRATPAQAKTSQAAAAYRNSPNGRQRCANCSWYEPPSSCGVVSGPVSARGWCNLWG